MILDNVSDAEDGVAVIFHDVQEERPQLTTAESGDVARRDEVHDDLVVEPRDTDVDIPNLDHSLTSDDDGSAMSSDGVEGDSDIDGDVLSSDPESEQDEDSSDSEEEVPTRPVRNIRPRNVLSYEELGGKPVFKSVTGGKVERIDVHIPPPLL